MKKPFAMLAFLFGILWASALDVTVSQPGTLGEVLGNDVSKIKELSVSGELNASDFAVLHEVFLNGKCVEMNLSDAVFTVLPSETFFDNTNYKSKVKKIILPEGLLEIGTNALSSGQIEEVILPSTLEIIDTEAFAGCGIKSIELPENLVFIGMHAFGQSSIEEISIPGNCRWTYTSETGDSKLPSSMVFFGCDNLKKVVLCEGIERIPGVMFTYCSALTEVELPSTLKAIGSNAFELCEALQTIELPDGLEEIENEAFNGCKSLMNITMPSTLKSLGVRALYGCDALKWIASKSAVAPECGFYIFDNVPYGPFGFTYKVVNLSFEDQDGLPEGLPIYIPEGSLESYKQDFYGWGYFSNFIETDEFPSSGVENVAVAPACGDGAVYDLQGRRVAEPRAGQIYISKGRKFVMH